MTKGKVCISVLFAVESLLTYDLRLQHGLSHNDVGRGCWAPSVTAAASDAAADLPAQLAGFESNSLFTKLTAN